MTSEEVATKGPQRDKSFDKTGVSTDIPSSCRQPLAAIGNFIKLKPFQFGLVQIPFQKAISHGSWLVSFSGLAYTHILDKAQLRRCLKPCSSSSRKRLHLVQKSTFKKPSSCLPSYRLLSSMLFSIICCSFQGRC